MKNRIFTLTLIFTLGFLFSFSSFLSAADNNPAPKCEKCYRGPDGKMKCETVPCPK